MRLYTTPKGRWSGTQAEHREACKGEGISAGHLSMDQTEVPTDKAGLIKFLNENRVRDPATQSDTPSDIDDVFASWPLLSQLRLAVAAIDRAYLDLERRAGSE